MATEGAGAATAGDGHGDELVRDPAWFEVRQGAEQHTSSWHKFYVRGAEALAREAGGLHDNHHTFDVSAGRLPAGALLTAWRSGGTKRGMDTADYWLLEADPVAPVSDLSYGSGQGAAWLRGRVRVLAHGDGPVRAKRLLAWWEAVPAGERAAARAAWLGAHITKRGMTEPPPFRPAPVPSGAPAPAPEPTPCRATTGALPTILAQMRATGPRVAEVRAAGESVAGYVARAAEGHRRGDELLLRALEAACNDLCEWEHAAGLEEGAAYLLAYAEALREAWEGVQRLYE